MSQVKVPYTVGTRDRIDKLLDVTGGWFPLPTLCDMSALVARTRLQYIVSKDRIKTGGYRRFQ